jgi:hypothetical protein
VRGVLVPADPKPFDALSPSQEVTPHDVDQMLGLDDLVLKELFVTNEAEGKSSFDRRTVACGLSEGVGAPNGRHHESNRVSKGGAFTQLRLVRSFGCGGTRRLSDIPVH